MTRITDLVVSDVRFPTSELLDGSDAMNPDPDYSAAYVELCTDDPGLRGFGMTFTIGRGNDLCCAAIEAFRPHVVGRRLDDLEGDQLPCAPGCRQVATPCRQTATTRMNAKLRKPYKKYPN